MYLNSRYVNGEIQTGTDHDGNVVELVTREFPQDKEFVLYRWKAGDRIDWIAESLGIPRIKWWAIMDANPLLRCPTFVQPGDLIKIPRVNK